MKPNQKKSFSKPRQQQTIVVEPNPYFEGIPFEEDVELAFDKCVEVLGKPGKYELTGEFVVLSTQLHGELWYGDLTKEDFEYRLPALAKVLGIEETQLFHSPVAWISL